MKRISIPSILFFAAAVCAAVLGVWLSFANLHSGTVLLSPPSAAVVQTEAAMDALTAADYSALEQMLLGTPDLGLNRDPADPVGVLIWDALEDSRSCRFLGELYATEKGLARDVELSYLDISSVTKDLRQRAQVLLAQRVAQAQDVSEIYDSNNEYREDFVMAVLRDAVLEALAEDAETTGVRITLELIYDNGQWWIVPDDALIRAISGGIAN